MGGQTGQLLLSQKKEVKIGGQAGKVLLSQKPEVKVGFGVKLAICSSARVRNLELESGLNWQYAHQPGFWKFGSQLVARPQKETRPLKVGELVVVSHDGRKRCDWELARILELIPGKDNVPRVALVKTQNGEYQRPVQRLHPLEMEMGNDEGEEKGRVRTRAGRVVRPPLRYQ